MEREITEIMDSSKSLLFGAAICGLAVALGAFGAHALQELLTSSGRTDTFETAVNYQFIHGLALIVVGAMSQKSTTQFWRWASLAFTLGVLFFSGSLYVISIAGITAFGMIAPIGGTAMILGWIFFFVAVIKSKKNPLSN